MDEPDSEEEGGNDGGMQVDQVASVFGDSADSSAASNSEFKLRSFITHLGASIHAGHYVAHCKNAENNWIYFNDAKVALDADPPIGKGYMYVFRKNGA